MSDESVTEPEPQAEAFLRRVGAVSMGLILGLALLPAILELLSLVGNVAAFRYQNF